MPPDIEMQEDVSLHHEVDDLSDWAQSDGDDTYDDDSWTLNSIVKSKTFDLGLHGDYTDWNSQEAFREEIQNWRDAIIEVNDMSLTDFCVYREEASAGRTTEIVFKAFRDGADRNKVEECLGFVRFKGRDRAGTVELANLNARLHPEHLQIGGTTKRGDENQAGAHGEGINLSALVFMRKNIHVRYQSSGFNWNFNFKNKCLAFSVHRIDMARKEARQPRKSTSKIATPEVVADRDVKLIIGESRRGRDEKGFQVKRGPVQQADFESWTKVALFLPQHDSEDTGVISTYHGDLLTAENQRGKIYLKGLLLCESTKFGSASLTGRPLRFGYNFAAGYTNRDRQSVKNASEESRAMCDILSGAMKEKPDMIGRLVDILNTTDIDYADIACAEKYWPKDVGLLIRGHLLEGEFANRWLYCGEDMNEYPRLRQAIEGIGRKPYEVSKKCWNILEKKKLVRNAEDEALWRFEHADEEPGPYPSFETSVARLLRACIRACPQAIDAEIEFIKAGQLHLDVVISEDQRLLRIHKRWLSFEDAIVELGLFSKIAEDKVLILAVKNLFADVLEQLPRKAFQQEDDPRSSESHMKREINRAEERLVSYQEMEVRVKHNSHDGRPGLCVEWPVNARRQDNNIMIEVQCHRTSRCSDIRDELLIAKDAERQKKNCLSQAAGKRPETQPGELQPQACRVSQVPFRQGMHWESDLVEGEEYFFALVIPTDPNSFVSMSDNKRVVAPSAARPNPSASASARRGPCNSAFRVPARNNGRNGNSVISVRRSSGSTRPPDEIQPPARAQNTAGGDGAAPEASNESGTIIPIGYISAMSRREKMDVVKLVAHDDSVWWDAELSDAEEDMQCVIGFSKGGKNLPDGSRKRRRMDEGVEEALSAL